MTEGQSVLLDALRAIAAHCVLVGHILSLSIFPGARTGLGDFGVIIFFILSGFLIASTCTAKADRGSYSFREYTLDRGCRIFAPYLPALCLVALMDGLILQNTTERTYAEYFTASEFLSNILMLQQFPPGIILDQLFGLEAAKLSTFGSARPFWTVANEWWLYLCFGILFFGIVLKSPFSGTVLLLIACIFPVFNIVAGTGAGLSLLWIGMALTGIYHARNRQHIGALSHRLRQSKTARLIAVLAVPFILILAGVRFVWASYLDPLAAPGTPVVYDFNLYVLLALASVVLFILAEPVKVVAGSRVIRFLADYSYSLYLIHYTVIYFCQSFGLMPDNGMIRFILLYGLCNLLAIFLWAAFERHHKKLRSWLTGIIGAGRA